MATARERLRDAYVAKAEAELGALAEAGVRCAGNAASPVLLAKGELSAEEAAGGRLLAGADGVALASALARLGYAPEDWACLASVGRDGAPLAPSLLREAVTCLDPVTLVLCDHAARDAVRDAYADELARIPSFEEAMLEDGVVASLLGMRALSLGGFAAALSSAEGKQAMWARLKRIPPLGEPW